MTFGFKACYENLKKVTPPEQWASLIPLFRASGISGRGNAEAAYTMV